jgi:SdpC family antimicrobial peptide
MWFRSRLKSVIAVVVGGTSLVYGLGPATAWASAASASGQSGAAQLHRYDGETLFRGLFFREGPVAQLYPNLSIAPQAPTAQGEQVINAVIARMRTMDPTFFTRFAAGIQSGSRLKTLAAIQDAQTLFDKALVAQYHAQTVTANGQVGYCFFGPIAVAIAGVLVLVLAGAGAVVVAAAAVYVYFWFYAPAMSSTERLAQEKWVNQIALSPLAHAA